MLTRAKLFVTTAILFLGVGAHVLMADSLCNDLQKSYCAGWCSGSGHGQMTGCYIDDNGQGWCYCDGYPYGPF
jgi:hypothetical protein